MDLIWVDELPEHSRPTLTNSVHNWDQVATELRKRPGEWALVARQIARSHATAIKRGERTAFQPPEDFLVTTRGRNEHLSDLYMAFVGAPGARARAMRRP